MSVLENLFKYETVSNWATIPQCDSMSANIYYFGDFMIQILSLGFSRTIGITKIIYPRRFTNYPYATVTDNNGGTVSANNKYVIDWPQLDSVFVNNLESGFMMLIMGRYR